MRKIIVAVAAFAAMAVAPVALATNPHKTLGPAGYNTPGGSTLIVAGPSGAVAPVLGSGDHVVICHATGGANGTEFNQIAPSASGVLNGHDGHEGDRDIIPPFVYRDNQGSSDRTLENGNNWSAANIAIYNNGCQPLPPVPPVVVPPVVPPVVAVRCPEGTTPVTSSNPLVCIRQIVREVIVEKIVEKIVLVNVPVVVEKVVFKDRIVNVPVLVEKIVFVTVPREVVREVVREVRVEVPGPVRTITVEKPVVVEKIVFKNRIVTKVKIKVVVKTKTRTIVKWKTKTIITPKPKSVPFTP